MKTYKYDVAVTLKATFEWQAEGMPHEDRERVADQVENDEDSLLEYIYGMLREKLYPYTTHNPEWPGDLETQITAE